IGRLALARQIADHPGVPKEGAEEGSEDGTEDDREGGLEDDGKARQPMSGHDGENGKARTPTKLAHFVVRSKRYEETVRWYETLLGARPVFANPFLTFLTFDDEHHRVAVVHVPDLEDASPRAA